jgi:SAM-dependent methyltransferase
MAKAYPNCKFYGFDNHYASIQYARNKAREEGLGEDRIRFEVTSSTNYPAPEDAEGEGYDLIAFFDCLHDMEDPQGAVAHALKTLKKPDGTVIIVEPFANDKIEDNLTPIGRMMYMLLQL